MLLARANLEWVVIANAIAWPLAYYLASNWLQRFAYRVHLNPEPFVWGGSVVLLIATATVGYHAMKAASASPVASLKCE